ncbi:hypothetical protein F3Y22_tig00110569pilonHSYRG00261 [Hibiscus syriacus]|uniref:Uncharacterized protein n=1 Tax=Hibiscus syriacus TaxID=106335 RepID=A0A6A3A7S9_HIBSY|nr:precursor of CEP6-like [Hibiscus syriacus]KAE8699986.1 hypothetical protein F3Y22_tig00110569pilonHSYRG00261 [Hibiscus syriacus]
MEFSPMHNYAVFVLAVIVCSHLVFYVNGRQMISVVIGDKDDHYRRLNVEQLLPPSIPAKTSRFEDDFRPYSPGNTFEEDDGDDNEGTPGSSSSVNGKHSSQDFKRTSPGHSPGVGHAFVNRDVYEKND